MTTQQLGNILNSMYNLEGVNKITMTFLFGVKYAAEIKKAAVDLSLNRVVNEIVGYSELSPALATEIKKAVALSDYVEVKRTTTI